MLFELNEQPLHIEAATVRKNTFEKYSSQAFIKVEFCSSFHVPSVQRIAPGNVCPGDEGKREIYAVQQKGKRHLQTTLRFCSLAPKARQKLQVKS